MGIEVIRDTSTTGVLLPEARTSIWQMIQGLGEVLTVVRAKRFCIVVGTNVLNIFATDCTSPAIIDPSQPQRKGSVPVQGTSLVSPVASVALENILNASFSKGQRHLWVFTSSGVHVIDLASPLPLAVTHVHEAKIGSGSVFDNHVVFSVQGSLFCSEIHGDVMSLSPHDMLSHMKGDWVISGGSNSSSLVALCCGCDQVVLLDLHANTTYIGALSGGSVLGVGVLDKSWLKGLAADGVYVHQKDAVSIYIVNEAGELDLVFQFRDTINRVQFDSVDISEGFMVMVSSESLNRRSNLELFDIGLIKQKCVALQPLIRYDISRLLVDSNACKVRFIREDGLLDFVLIFPEGEHVVGMVWESVPRDQWFAFMPNFKALNKNEPYVEPEDEFDFNQEADEKSIRMTVSRYKPVGNMKLDFFQNGAVPFKKLKMATVDIGSDGELSESRLHAEPMYPFLQPVKAWGGKGWVGTPVSKAGTLSVPAAAEFFGPRCMSILKNAVR